MIVDANDPLAVLCVSVPLLLTSASFTLVNYEWIEFADETITSGTIADETLMSGRIDNETLEPI